MELIFTQQMSKVKQLADALSAEISIGEYAPGDPLPSINRLSRQYGVSRDTVFKAFNELKIRGVVDSAPTKGYYVCNAVHRILLLLDTYSPFKYQLHDAITKNLSTNYKVDLYFHQCSQAQFNKIIRESVGRYNLYLVMNYRNDVYSEILDLLDASKVLLLDFGKFEKDRFAYVCQGFDQTLYDCMVTGLPRFRHYKKIVLVFPDNSEHPQSCIPYFVRFCEDHGFPYDIVNRIEPNAVETQVAYLIVKHSHLIDFVKLARNRKWKLGKDVGVVVYNDEPVFEILDNGISVISTDFDMMGVVAAKFILTGEHPQVYIPTRLILRGSL